MSAAANVPERPSLDGIEAPLMDRWDAAAIYSFDRQASREDVFAIDTPPPTVSGSIHMGTVFGYTQVDAVARHQRMRGKAVFFPIGWDDNGLARGEAYSAEAPTLWDIDDRTAVAQAEMEDRERPGAYHLVAFHGATGDVVIDTTRPELIVSCVALVAHPDDVRFQPLFGSTV